MSTIHTFALRGTIDPSQRAQWMWLECSCGTVQDIYLPSLPDWFQRHAFEWERDHCTHDSGTGYRTETGELHFECDLCGRDTDDRPGECVAEGSCQVHRPLILEIEDVY